MTFSSRPSPSQTPGPSILIVEDCVEAVPALQIALETYYACPVHHCSDGLSAMAYLAELSVLPLAIITDLNLPRADGFELINVIRRSDVWSKIPVIVITANTDPNVRNRVLGLGADRFFPKPYSPAAICTSLESILHEKDLHTGDLHQDAQTSSKGCPLVSDSNINRNRADQD